MRNENLRSKYIKQLFHFIFQLLAVWILIVPFLLLWLTIFTYSPAEVTELQSLPLIMQGDTDWGGANSFAAYVSGHFLFGFLACLLLTKLLNSSDKKRSRWNYLSSWPVFWGFVLAFILGNLSYINVFIEFLQGTTVWLVEHRRYDHYVCDYISVLILFTFTYCLSVLWIIAVSKSTVSKAIKYLVSPLMLVFLFIMALDGFTPKAGQIMQSGQIPERKPLSAKHNLILKVHDYCLQCSGYSKQTD